jgi:hypothetical protein
VTLLALPLPAPVPAALSPAVLPAALSPAVLPAVAVLLLGGSTPGPAMEVGTTGAGLLLLPAPALLPPVGAAAGPGLAGGAGPVATTTGGAAAQQECRHSGSSCVQGPVTTLHSNACSQEAHTSW